MSEAILKSNAILNSKKVSISSKRQITIPQKFFTMLGFSDEAECIVKDNELIIRPVKNNNFDGEFATQILKDLVAQGLSGEQLVEAFDAKQKEIRPAVEYMLEEAKKVAEGDGEFSSYDDLFAAED